MTGASLYPRQRPCPSPVPCLSRGWGASSLTPARWPLAHRFLGLHVWPSPAAQSPRGQDFTASWQRADTQALWPRPSQSDCGHSAPLRGSSQPLPRGPPSSQPSSGLLVPSADPLHLQSGPVDTVSPRQLASRGLLGQASAWHPPSCCWMNLQPRALLGPSRPPYLAACSTFPPEVQQAAQTAPHPK